MLICNAPFIPRPRGPSLRLLLLACLAFIGPEFAPSTDASAAWAAPRPRPRPVQEQRPLVWPHEMAITQGRERPGLTGVPEKDLPPFIARPSLHQREESLRFRPEGSQRPELLSPKYTEEVIQRALNRADQDRPLDKGKSADADSTDICDMNSSSTACQDPNPRGSLPRAKSLPKGE